MPSVSASTQLYFAQSDRCANGLARLVAPLVRIDAEAIERSVEALRRRYPGETERELARRCVRNASWHAGTVSLALALPVHPLAALASAVAEVLILRRIEVATVARIRCLYAPRAFRSDGASAVHDPDLTLDPTHLIAAELWSLTRGKMFGAALEHAVGQSLSRAVRTALKRAGVEACLRRMLGNIVPVAAALGGAIGSARHVTRDAERALARFEGPRHGGRARDARGIKNASARRPAARTTARPRSSAHNLAVEAAMAAIRAGDALAALARRVLARTKPGRIATASRIAWLLPLEPRERTTGPLQSIC